MKKLLHLLTLLLLAQPLPLLAQGAPGAQARIDAAIARATAARMPASLLEDKVAEGRAKGVPLERIAAAVEQRAALLLRAQEAMGSTRAVRATDLSVGADALHAGVSAEALRAVSEAAPEQSRAVAIAVLSQLVAEGHASDEALSRVKAALARGGGELVRLPAEAARGRSGEAPGKGVGRGGGPPASVPAPGAPAGKPGKGPPDGKGPPPGRGKPGG